jgi:pimeloyl-ACP methyl ester carboxylesterase
MKSTVKFILVWILALGSMQARSQDTNDQMSGSWQGILNAGTVELRLVFNISLSDDGSYTATLDSPDQGTMGIPLGKVSVTADSLRIEAPGLLGFYIGKITSSSTTEGEWHQAGRSFTLDLEKKDEVIVLNRPQEPRAPFPYMEEEVSFVNTEQGFSLGGTLSLPEGDGPFPAAVLVSGSGSQNRDEEIFGHKPFKLIADYLTRNGIAVLRYDDRGVASSGGKVAGSTSADLAVDARAAVVYLLDHDKIDASKIGVIGHSEGGMIAFMLASSQKDLAYIVSLAGTGTDGKTILLDQSEHIARLRGASDDILEDYRNLMSGVYDIMSKNDSYESWEEETIKFASEFYSERIQASYSEEDIERGKENLLASIPEAAYAWMRYFVMFDPAPLFDSITCPVLALNGEKDCQVLPEQNISAIKNGLERAGNKKAKTMILPGLNHLFQNCETGLPDEYGVIEETFDQRTLEMMSEWILGQAD